MNYLDFELEISSDTQNNYSIAVIRSPAGEVKESIRFPFSELQLENRLLDLELALLRSSGKRRRVLSPEEQTVQDFGQELFDFLLPNEVRSLYRASLSKAIGKNHGLRLKLRLKDVPELAALPWEFLYDQNDAEYVCLSHDTPIVRYIDVPRPPTPLQITPPLRILGMVASPKDLPELDVDHEKERVERAVADLQARGLVELVWLQGQTWRDLQKTLRRGPWHIFHFIGHGGFNQRKDEGFVAFCDAQGEERAFTASELARLLANQRSLRLVLLNACKGGHGSQNDIFSSTAAILVRRGMPAVLAMQYEITDRAAIELARSFYEALADGLPVEAAVTDARQSISFAAPQSVEWVTPVLYMRSPDGKLFDVQQAGPTEPIRQSKPPRQELPPEVPEVETPVENDIIPSFTQLHSNLMKGFNLSELQSLCFELGVEFEELPGGVKSSKVREFIAYMERRQRLEELLRLCEQKRPHLQWRETKPRQIEQPPGYAAIRELEKDSFVHEKTGLEFLRIAAGEFLYGDNKEPKDLPEYWISKMPVTQAVYQRFISDRPEQDLPRGWDQKKRLFVGDMANHPVVRVSWYDAVAFCKWAELVLPTEEQWEKVARGMKGLIYPWGEDKPTDKLCNFGGNEGGTTPVGRYSPQGDSPYGCVDMSGNVWEWCLNKYDDPEVTTIDQSGDWRVLRGGSWRYGQNGVRAASRYGNHPDARLFSLGFRVVLVRPPSQGF